MDKTSPDSNGTPLHQDPPTPRAAPTAAERVAAAEAIVAEMVADPEWQDKLSTYEGEVAFNAEAVREFGRRYSAKLGTNLELSEGVAGGGVFIAPEETPESRANKALWLLTAQETELPRPDPSYKLPAKAKWLVDDVSFEFTHPTESTEVSVASCPAQSVSPDLDNASPQMSFEFSCPVDDTVPLATPWPPQTVRLDLDTLPIRAMDATEIDPAHGALLPFYNADLGHVFAAPSNDFDPGHAVLPSEVRKNVARNASHQPHKEPELGVSLVGQCYEIKAKPDDTCSNYKEQDDA